MAWPDFTIAPDKPTARTILTHIIMRSDGWLATHAPDPDGTPAPTPRPGIPGTERQRWQRIREDAEMDRGNIDHPRLRDKVDAQGNAANGGTLDLPWNQVFQARACIYKPAPSMGDLQAAIEFVDHLGGGGVGGNSNQSPPPDPIVTGLWPDVAYGMPKVTARQYLDAILSHAVGHLVQPTLSSPLRSAYEKLALDTVLDRANVAHGKLRNFVKASGKSAVGGGLRMAWNHVREALVILNGNTVGTAQVAQARKRVRHEI